MNGAGASIEKRDVHSEVEGGVEAHFPAKNIYPALTTTSSTIYMYCSYDI